MSHIRRQPGYSSPNIRVSRCSEISWRFLTSLERCCEHRPARYQSSGSCFSACQILQTPIDTISNVESHSPSSQTASSRTNNCRRAYHFTNPATRFSRFAGRWGNSVFAFFSDPISHTYPNTPLANLGCEQTRKESKRGISYGFVKSCARGVPKCFHNSLTALYARLPCISPLKSSFFPPQITSSTPPEGSDQPCPAQMCSLLLPSSV